VRTRIVAVADVEYRGPSIRGSLIFTVAGVALGGLLGALVSAWAGALVVALTLAGAGVWRAVSPKATHAAGIAVRSRAFDVVFYVGLAAAIAILALTAPSV
jgi:hypothetical protein